MTPRPPSASDIVSVIIPAFNAASWIRETLDSVLGQTHAALEVIVVDDGSTDATAALVESFGQNVRLLSQANSGNCSVPRNRGLAASTGTFITFFDADDVMEADKIERQVAFLMAHPDLDVVTSDYREFDDKGPHPLTHFARCHQLQAILSSPGFDGSLTPADATRILASENYSIASSPLYRRSLFDDVRPFDETLPASEDFDLAYRVARAGRTGVLPHVGFRRRLHHSNMSWQTLRVLCSKLQSRSRLLESGTREPQRTLLANAVAACHLDVADELGRERRTWREVLPHLAAAYRMGRLAPYRSVKALARPTAYALGWTRRG